MSLRSPIIGALGWVFLAGCAGKPAPVENAKLSDAPQGPIIVRLVGQHHRITVTSGPEGPLYTAETTAGETLVANATLAELQTDHPEIYQFVEPSLAVDASLDGQAPSRGTRKGFKGSVSGANRDNFILDARQ